MSEHISDFLSKGIREYTKRKSHKDGIITVGNNAYSDGAIAQPTCLFDTTSNQSAFDAAVAFVNRLRFANLIERNEQRHVRRLVEFKRLHMGRGFGAFRVA